MSLTTWMIVIDDQTWQLAKLTSTGNTLYDSQVFDADDADRTLEVIIDEIERLGYSGERVLLALGSRRCVPCTLPNRSGKSLPHRQQLIFELEEMLPWEAENIVADFSCVGDELFVVAVATPEIKHWLNVLEARGILIESIVPLALLGLAHHVECGEAPVEQTVVWQHGGQCELLVVHQERPCEWLVLPSTDSASLRNAIKVLALQRPQATIVTGYQLDAALTHELQTHPDVDFREASCELSLLEAAAEMAGNILNAKSAAWIELRRDQLGASDRWRTLRGSLRITMAMAAIFLVALTASFLVRAEQYDRQFELATQQLTESYQLAFPGETVPAGIHSRLESELKRIQGMHGESNDAPSSVPAMDMLYHVLASLPQNLRFQIREIRIDQGRLDINGQVRNHADVDQMATALREQGFEVSSPSTERASSQSVRVRISGFLHPPKVATQQRAS